MDTSMVAADDHPTCSADGATILAICKSATDLSQVVRGTVYHVGSDTLVLTLANLVDVVSDAILLACGGALFSQLARGSPC